jgi:hemoglobin
VRKNHLLAILSALFVSSSLLAQAATPVPAPSLYKRLGGYDAIAAVTDDLLVRLISDKQINRFLVGLSEDSKGKLRQHFVEFLCFSAGGPCVYTARDMKTAHKGMGITESDFELSVKHLVASLDKFKVPQKEKDEVLALVSSLKKDIVEKP